MKNLKTVVKHSVLTIDHDFVWIYSKWKKRIEIPSWNSFQEKRKCKYIYYFLELLAKKYFLVDLTMLQQLYFVTSDSFDRLNTKFQY